MQLRRDKKVWQLLELNTGLRFAYEESLDRIYKLHEEDAFENCLECSFYSDDPVSYPCRTIQAARGTN